MGVCRQYRIPHSHFLGGPPRWTDIDQDKAIAHEELLATSCHDCGTRLEEWEEDLFAYIGYSWRCPGCEVMEQERENVPEGEKGIHVGLLPRQVAEQQEEAEREAKRRRDER